MPIDPLKTFIRDTRGEVAVEAVWSLLILSIFLLPTVSLFVITDTRLKSNILLRAGARNEAINNSCSDTAFYPLQVFQRSDTESTTTLGCRSINAEASFSSTKDRYWERMKSVSNDFPNFLRDFGNKGRITSVQGTVGVLGNTSSPGAIITSTRPQIKMPVEETWRFSKAPWKNGHDKIIWSRMPRGAKPLFRDVFPAKAR